jgi:hypothetical protein
MAAWFGSSVGNESAIVRARSQPRRAATMSRLVSKSSGWRMTISTTDQDLSPYLWWGGGYLP